MSLSNKHGYVITEPLQNKTNQAKQYQPAAASEKPTEQREIIYMNFFKPKILIKNRLYNAGSLYLFKNFYRTLKGALLTIFA